MRVFGVHWTPMEEVMADQVRGGGKNKQEKKQTAKACHAMTPEQRKLYDLRRSQRKVRPFNGSVAGRQRLYLARVARAEAKLVTARERWNAQRVADEQAAAEAARKALLSARAKKGAATRAAKKAAKLAVVQAAPTESVS